MKQKKLELPCPWCGDKWLSQAFSISAAPQLKPGMILPCQNCMELATVTPEITLRKATGLERRDVMNNPDTRKVIEQFAALSQEYKRLRQDMGQSQ